jgi:hypothetical protein
MSRHRLPTKTPRYEVVVGWDPPMQTYFAQVFDAEGEELDQPFIWLGADGWSVPWSEIAGALAPYASVSRELIAVLLEDRKLNRG